MNRAPSFQFYPKDWLDIRVQRMTLAAQGAYLKNLCYMWADSHDQCSIVDDNALIARALGTTVEHWLELRKEIQCESDPIFEAKDGYLVSGYYFQCGGNLPRKLSSRRMFFMFHLHLHRMAR